MTPDNTPLDLDKLEAEAKTGLIFKDIGDANEQIYGDQCETILTLISELREARVEIYKLEDHYQHMRLCWIEERDTRIALQERLHSAEEALRNTLINS